MNSLIISLLAGAIGTGYFIYGKRQARFVFILTGLALCFYPYFFDSVLWLCLVGFVLAALPFVFDL